jgi:hypothetical protein
MKERLEKRGANKLLFIFLVALLAISLMVLAYEYLKPLESSEGKLANEGSLESNENSQADNNLSSDNPVPEDELREAESAKVGGAGSSGGAGGSGNEEAPAPERLPSDLNTAPCGIYFSRYNVCAGSCEEGACVQDGRSCYCKIQK